MIASGAPIPLDTNVTLNGTSITHTPGSTDILLAPNETYYITYRTKAELTTAGNIIAHTALTLMVW